MFRWLRKRLSPDRYPNELIFKGTDQAFEYAARYFPRLLEEGGTLIGQVLGKGGIRVGEFEVKGEYYRVRLATSQGVVEVSNCGTSLDSDTPTGSLVMVEAAVYQPHTSPDHRLNYFVILARLEPVLLASNNNFRVIE